jgi:hypothetical protein
MRAIRQSKFKGIELLCGTTEVRRQSDMLSKFLNTKLRSDFKDHTHRIRDSPRCGSKSDISIK